MKQVFYSLLLLPLALAAQQPEWQLVWSDEFNGERLDTTRWNIQLGDGCPRLCGWGNNELQLYRARNITVADGYLTIHGRREANGSYTSARINTNPATGIKGFDFTYGRVEVRAKMPAGQGSWPAAWLLPTENYYGIWPLSGEIDIVEAHNLAVDGRQTVLSSIHYGYPYPNNKYNTDEFEPELNPQDSFNVYAMEWEEGAMRFYFNGIHFSTQTQDQWFTSERDGKGGYKKITGSAPFNQKFHLLLNYAIGGNLPGKPDPTIFPQQYVIDYVRVYQRKTDVEK